MLRGRCCFNGIVLNARARISAPIRYETIQGTGSMAT